MDTGNEQRVAKWNKFAHIAAVTFGMPLVYFFGFFSKGDPNILLLIGLLVAFELCVGGLFLMLNRFLFK